MVSATTYRSNVCLMGRLHYDMYDPSMMFGKNGSDIVYRARKMLNVKNVVELCRNRREQRVTKTASLRSVMFTISGGLSEKT